MLPRKLCPRASPYVAVVSKRLFDGRRELRCAAGDCHVRHVCTQCGERRRYNRLFRSQVLEDLERVHRPRVLVDEEGNRAHVHGLQELGKPSQVRRAEKVDVLKRLKRTDVEASEDRADEDDRPFRVGLSDKADELSINALVDLSDKADDRSPDRGEGGGGGVSGFAARAK